MTNPEGKYQPSPEEIKLAESSMTEKQNNLTKLRANETALLPGISLPEALENGAEVIKRVSDINLDISKDLEEGLVTERSIADMYGIDLLDDENVFLYMDGGPTNLVFVKFPKPGTPKYSELTER